MNKSILYLLFSAILMAAGILFYFQGNSATATELQKASVSTELTLTMYHAEGCACCVKWAEYLEEHGVTVIDELTGDLQAVKREHSVPARLGSCHTALVDGYVVEGHVPFEDIQRLIDEQPDAIGISVPGMPPNAPGMDMPVSREYQVILFDNEQNMKVYNTHK